METRKKLLIKNTMLFALGNFGSKILQILLIPFYTRVMTNSEYGVVDVMQALVALLLPMVSLSVFESVFRYAMDKEYDRDKVLAVGWRVNQWGNLVLFCLGFLMMRFFDPLYVWLVIANTAMVALWTLFSNYAKAVDRLVLYSVNNIILTGSVLILNILFLTVLRWGILGYMLGYILANAIATAVLIWGLRKEIHWVKGHLERQLVMEMLMFSLPLVLNGICWWLSNFTDRIMITALAGSANNGLYAASSKFPHLLSTLISIFCQAWQISANQEFDSEDAAGFYSGIYDDMSGCVFVGASLLILFCRPLNVIVLGASYYSAWRVIPVLTLASMFYAFAAFLVSIYSANKRTTMAFVTNLISVLINVVCNYVMILRWGILGAAIATTISYAVLWIVRIWDTGRILAMRYHGKKIAVGIGILLIQSVLVCWDRDIICTYGLCFAGLLVICGLYRDVIRRGLQFGVSKFRGIRGSK